MIIANIQSLNEVDRAQVLGHFSKNTVAPAKDATVGATKDAEKKKNANKGRATCYADFAKKVMEEQKDAIAAFKLANPELKGAHLSFVGTYKKDHAEEFTAFETAWKLAHPKEEAPKNEVVVEKAKPEVEAPKSDAESVDAKPKRVMTDEQKAKMKAGREAAKAKKAAQVDQTVAKIEATVEAEVLAGVAAKEAARVAVSMAAELMGHGEVPEEQPVQQVKKRGPKKLEAMTPEERAKHDAKKAERQAKKAADKAAGRPTVDTDTGSDVSAPSVPSARSASPKQKAE
jgi:hypothetical protein